MTVALIAPVASVEACDDDCAPDCGDCVLCGATASLVSLSGVDPAPALGLKFAPFSAARGEPIRSGIEHVPLPSA